MTLYPLALLPQVTISGGRAQFPLSPGSDAEYGDPDEVITAFVEQGAAWVHVVDADAAAGKAGNYPALARATNAHVQLAGGIADEQALQASLAAKPSRVVVDPTDLGWVQDALQRHGDLLTVALDLGSPDAMDLRPTLDDAGCTRYLLRDSSVHGRWRRGDRHLLQEFCEQTDSAIMVEGGVQRLDDLHELHELVPSGLDGIVIDEPLYDGGFLYAEAVAASANRFDMFYWGPPKP